MATVTSIDLFNALKDKVGEKEAKMLTEFMEYNAVDALDKAKSQLATKDDILKLGIATKEDITRSERALKEDISKLEKSTREDILKLEKATREDILRLEKATHDDISRLEKATHDDISRLEKATREEFVNVKTDISTLRIDIAKMDTKIAETKADLLKWMIVLFAPFYIGMIVFLIKQFLH